MASTHSDLQQYGVPFYGAGWVPYDHVRSKLSSQVKIVEDNKEDKNPTQPKDDQVSASQNYVVLAGGGGEGRSGIPNAVVVSHVDSASNSLSDKPVVMFRTGSDLPYRMTVHPRGDGIICAFQKSCRMRETKLASMIWSILTQTRYGYALEFYQPLRLFEWEECVGNEVHKLSVKVSEKVLTQLEDVGQQLALKYNSEGSKLAVGGEDGGLRVFKWPTMEIILNEALAHSSIKDLDFSCDGNFLVSLGSGLCRIWDVTSSKVVASLAKGNDEIFAFSRFSQINDKNPVLYIAAVTDHGGSILTWNTTTWKRMRSNRVVREAISAFNVSADGKFLAVALISSSLDSSARLTLIKDKTKSGGISWLIVFMVLLAIAVYFMREKGIIP